MQGAEICGESCACISFSVRLTLSLVDMAFKMMAMASSGLVEGVGSGPVYPVGKTVR